MACCCLLSDEPVEGERRNIYYNHFQNDLMHSPWVSCTAFTWCMCQCFPLTSPCTQCFLRRKALRYNMHEYTCCQGYFLHKGQMPGESSCPSCCLFLESCLCPCLAISSTRMMIMDLYQIQPEKLDNQIIRFNNALQCLSIVCDCLAHCIDSLRNCKSCIDCCAQCSYYTVSGCMTAQVATELELREAAYLERRNSRSVDMDGTVFGSTIVTLSDAQGAVNLAPLGENESKELAKASLESLAHLERILSGGTFGPEGLGGPDRGDSDKDSKSTEKASDAQDQARTITIPPPPHTNEPPFLMFLGAHDSIPASYYHLMRPTPMLSPHVPQVDKLTADEFGIALINIDDEAWVQTEYKDSPTLPLSTPLGSMASMSPCSLPHSSSSTMSSPTLPLSTPLGSPAFLSSEAATTAALMRNGLGNHGNSGTGGV